MRALLLFLVVAWLLSAGLGVRLRLHIEHRCWLCPAWHRRYTFRGALREELSKIHTSLLLAIGFLFFRDFLRDGFLAHLEAVFPDDEWKLAGPWGGGEAGPHEHDRALHTAQIRRRRRKPAQIR